MKTPAQYLDDLKEQTGSDYKTAKLLNSPQATLTTIRKRGQMSDETAIKIADLLRLDRTELLIAAAMARSEGETKAAWMAAAAKFGIAANWLIFIAHTLTPKIFGALVCILC